MIWKGILLYFTFFMTILYIAIVDSITHPLIVALPLVILYLICNTCITKEKLNKLTFMKND